MEDKSGKESQDYPREKKTQGIEILPNWVFKLIVNLL